MGIASLVVRSGIGSWGDIAHLITRGILGGSSPPAVVSLDPSLELQRAIFTVLNDDADLQSLIGNPPRIYQDVPQGKAWPGSYVTIGEGQDVPDLAECIDGSELFVPLHIWSRAAGFNDCKKIAATIWAALEDATLSLSDNRFLLIEREDEQYMRDPDGITKHAVLTLRTLTEPTDPSDDVNSYIGPLDLAPGAILAYGQRAMTAATLGMPLYTIQRTVDDAVQVFSSDATTGDAPTADMDAFIGAATFNQTGNVITGNQDIELVDATGVKTGQLAQGANIPADSLVTALESGTTILISEAPTATDPAELLTFTQAGIVSEWNDQSMSGANATSDSARIVIDQQNGRPSIRSWGNFQTSFSAAANGGVFTVVAAAPYGWTLEVDASANNGFVFAGATSGGPSAHCVCDAGINPDEAGGIKDLPQDDTIHLISYVWQYGARQFQLDGVNQEFDTVTDSGGPIGDMVLDNLNQFLSSSVGFRDVTKGGFEFILWPRALSPSELAAVTQNMAAYYGITLS